MTRLFRNLFCNNCNEDCCDTLICELLACSMDCIVDAWVTDAALAGHECERKKKRLGARLEQRRLFCSPSVVSADGLLGKERVKILLKKLLSARLAEKWEKSWKQIPTYRKSTVGRK